MTNAACAASVGIVDFEFTNESIQSSNTSKLKPIPTRLLYLQLIQISLQSQSKQLLQHNTLLPRYIFQPLFKYHESDDWNGEDDVDAVKVVGALEEAYEVPLLVEEEV